MKNLITLLFILISYSSISQVKEVVKIDVGKDCKDCISKRTYKGEMYTQRIDIMKGWGKTATLVFGYSNDSPIYEDRGVVMYINMDRNFFIEYDLDHLYFTVNGKEFDLTKLIAFNKYESVVNDNETISYAIGYMISSELDAELNNVTEFSCAMINKKTAVRKTWNFNESFCKHLTKSYKCFKEYYLPLEEDRLKKKEEQYQAYLATIKSFDKNFRNAKWGQSRSQVKAGEEVDILAENESGLSTEVTLNGDKYFAHFFFTSDRFYRGVYTFQEDYVNENNFYNKYKELKKVLSSKYGEPYKVIKNRTNDRFEEANEIGLAIQTGEYSELTTWETKESVIMLYITGENYDSDLKIEYRTKDPVLYLDARKEIKESRTDGF